MSQARKLVWHAISLGGSGLLARTAMVFIGFLVARHFGPQEFGRYATAFALSTMFLSLSNVGVSFNLMKVTAEGQSDLPTTYGNTLLITTALAVVLYLALVVTGNSLGYPTETRQLIWVLGPVVMLLSFHEVFSAIAQGRELMGRIAVFRTAYAFVLLAAIVGIILSGEGLVTFCIVALVGVGALTLVWLFVTNRMVFPRVELRRIPHMVRRSYLYGLSAFFFIIYFRIDTVMLSLMRTEAEVGEYNAAYQVIELLFKAPVLISFVTMPLAFSVASERSRVLHIYQAKVRHLGVLGALATLAVMVLAEPLLSVAVGPQYTLAPQALRVLSIVVVAKFLAVAAGDTLTTLDRQGVRTAIQGGVALLNVGLNLLLIPRFGIFGAAWATVASEATLAAGYYVGVKRVWGGEGISVLLSRALASLATGGLVAGVSYLAFGRYAAAILGLLCVLGLAIGLGLVRQAEIKALFRRSGERPEARPTK